MFGRLEPFESPFFSTIRTEGLRYLTREGFMRRVIFGFMVLGLFAAVGMAQTTGRLSGSVSSPDGLIPGATVMVTDNQTGKSQNTITNATGAFKFEKLPFGIYTIKITSQGFKTYIANDVKIDAGQEYTLNPTLEVGDISVIVTVEAGADLINSSNAELSTTVSPKQILDLPIDGRNPLSLLSLQAGVNATAFNHVNGQRTSSTNFTRDGINVQDNFIRTGGFVQDRPSVDDTGEFTVTTQNSGADLGGGGSAQIRLITPRGGNEFHGAGYLYNRNNYFAANEFGNNAVGVEKPFLNRNQFGGKIGGPLPLPGFGVGTPWFHTGKAFFFVNYERFLLRQTTSKDVTVLKSQFRNGTFTYTDSGGTQRTVNILSGMGLDLSGPNAGVFTSAGGAIPVDPTIQTRVLDRAPGVGNGVDRNGILSQQLLFNQANNDTRDGLTMRFDFDINDSNGVYFVYKYNKNADDRTDIDGTFNVTPVNTQGGPTNTYLMSYTTVLGSNFTNEIRGAYSSSDPFFFRDPNFPTDYLIGGIPFTTNPQSTFQSQGRKTDQYTLQNNSSYSSGNHTLRFGIDYNAQRITSETNFGATPTFNISSTANPQTPGLTNALFPGGISSTDLSRANSLRYFLGGIVGSGSVAASFVNPSQGLVIGAPQIEDFKYDTYGLYFADSWRATRELTLNLGLRWDYFSPLKNPDLVYLEPDLEGASGVGDIRTNMLDPTGRYVLIGNNSGVPGQFFKADKNNFGPVLSFAYGPRDRGGFMNAIFGDTGVVRGGFRVGYINDEYVRGPDNAAGANAGLGRVTVNALVGGNPQFNRRFNSLPGFITPAAPVLPISFAQGNAANGFFFNTVFAVDPDIQMQRNHQYNLGFSREIGFDTAIEFRYVGGRSNNMVRGFDFNQVRIEGGGFLNDFLAARNNCRIAVAQSPTRYLDTGCSSAEMRGTGLPGQVTVGPTINGLLGFGIIRDYIQRGIVGQMALLYIQNGLNGFGGADLLLNPNAGVVDLLTNGGKYRYDSFQFEVRKRFTDGLQFQGNYTFGKTLSDIQGDGQTRFDPFLDYFNQGLEYARADYDRTHTININANYELPFGRGKWLLNRGGIVDKIFGGWQLTSIMNFSSGQPISIKDINGTLNRTGRSNRQTANSNLSIEEIRALTGLVFQDGRIYYINPSVISSVPGAGQGSATNGNLEPTVDNRFPGQVFFRAQPGQTGTLPRNFLDGPWYYNVDAGLIKNIRFGERFNVQFRAEAFNVFNKTNWFIGENSSIFDVDSSSFGQVSLDNNYGPRIMQFAVRLEF